jgi:pyridoxamine 5'-phosphate oxidase-like protein
VLTWGEFSRARPELAAAGRALFYQFGGVGLGFLGTVRRDGGPRLHPVRVVLANEGMFTFLIASPKQRDLLRDPRYALHCYPPPENEDAFYVIGDAHLITDAPELRSRLARQFRDEMSMPFDISELDSQFLFEHRLATCLHTVTTGHGDPQPAHTVWRAG